MFGRKKKQQMLLSKTSQSPIVDSISRGGIIKTLKFDKHLKSQPIVLCEQE
jgi:hypothetical protein